MIAFFLWLFVCVCVCVCVCLLFFLQTEDGIRDLVRSRGLGDVYKRQAQINNDSSIGKIRIENFHFIVTGICEFISIDLIVFCLLYTSDAADERSSVDLGGRRIIKKKKNTE